MKINIKKFICILLIGILSLNLYSNAFSASNNSEVVDRFTKKQYNLLFESNLSNISSEYGDIFNMSKKVDIFKNLSESIRKSRETIESENTNILKRITNLEESKKILEKDIEDTINKIKDLSLLSIQTKKEIETNEKKVEFTKNKVNENKKILLSYLDYMYKKGNTAYEGQQIDNLKTIILNNEDISNVINDLYFNGIIQLAGKNLIEKYMKFIGELYIQKVELENKKVEFAKLRKNLIIEQKNLKDKKEFKERIIRISKNRQKEYEKLIAEKVKTENKVKEIAEKEEKKIKELRDKILSENNCQFIDFSKETKGKLESLKKGNEKCYNLNNIIFLEGQLSSSNPGTSIIKNPLDWPINPVSGLSAYFKDPGYKREIGADHNAIDIRAKQGTEIRSPMAGYVIYINPPTTKDYSFLAIKHPGGYTTVYGHLSEIDVKQFQYVEKGQVIGKTGGEYGTNGAGFLTTGPHLHFEVFKNKEYIDPLDVLDLSYLKYNSLPLSPAKYKIKYLNDFKDRKGYEFSELAARSKIFRLKGDNEIERQKYLINKYAAGSFNNWKLWVDQALLGNIDPSVIMCIGLAESGLGRNVTTAFNVGNVGNNDRGDRVGFGNAKQGIYAIVRTLNNRFFSSVNRLDMLSGAGRINSGLPPCRQANQYCYATDPKYWHPNVITCLSHLKGRIVEDDYNFRIVK